MFSISLSFEIVRICSHFTIHLQPYIRDMFGTKEGMLPVTENISKRTLALPFHNNLKEEEVDEVVSTLKKVVEKVKS
ncbi:MAG: DegT/DnrJ/EryC1/StrS family aminotransferase [Dictyoglomus sp.]|uniref:DegT/DnrJ/EryC1/StrS family aminotransferase n=1 Tax=Dictyoglomus sp. TaxID=28205 RepID=UPI003D0AE917